MRNVPYPIEKIINVANELATNGLTGASTSEVIAAAFVLDRMEYILKVTVLWKLGNV